MAKRDDKEKQYPEFEGLPLEWTEPTNDPVTNIEDTQEKPVESYYEPKKAGNTKNLRLVSAEIFQYGGVEKVLMVTVDRPLRGFLVDRSLVEWNIKKEQPIDVSEQIEVYNWEQELAEMLPNIEVVRENMLRSFWQAGAVDKDSVNDPKVRHRLYLSAFPYKLPE